MSAPPAGGGAPLVFETLSDLICHPDLNAVRQRRWNVNRNLFHANTLTEWALSGKKPPAPGDVVALVPGKLTEPSAKGLRINKTRTTPNPDFLKIATETDPDGTWRKGYADMWYAPDQTATGIPVSFGTVTFVTVDEPGRFTPGNLVEVRRPDETVVAVIAAVVENRIGVDLGVIHKDVDALRPLIPYDFKPGYVDTALNVDKIFFNAGGTVSVELMDKTNFVAPSSVETGAVFAAEGIFALRFRAPVSTTYAGALNLEADFVSVTGADYPPKVSAILSNPSATVGFLGKPPKLLTEGSYFVAHYPDGELAALRVRGVRKDKNQYWVHFNSKITHPHEKTTFFGPMTQVIRPRDHDRNMDPILDDEGKIVLLVQSEAAKALIRQGRQVIIEDMRETGNGSVLATVDAVNAVSKFTEVDKGERDQVEVRFSGNSSDFGKFVTGWTVFRFNTAPIGHGETKPGKTLGSGNGEKPRQTLPFDVKGVSFSPDPTTSTGVRPDITVTVDGDPWDHADLTDATAEDTPRYSVRPCEDGTLDIVFRRRLPSGRNNIRVSRYRVGHGAVGNAIGPRAITKPKSKHPHVDGIVQPFAATGGADREETDTIRQNAGASIAANNRAVSLQDFTRLTRRHASVWDARAEQVVRPGRAELVRITVVPANGAPLDTALTKTLKTFVADKALPGTTLEFQGFSQLPMTIDATLRIDTTRYLEQDIREAAEAALINAFALKNRQLGQAFYVAKVLATLEQVSGVETAQATIAVKAGTTTTPDQLFKSRTGALRAVYPRATQVCLLAALSDITLTITGLTQ
ncbi:baseplate J/gp47 family protein [Palleronia caenipelagi]|nr:baseplate J/gp47 family protein [Palleronia caenipelagi]